MSLVQSTLETYSRNIIDLGLDRVTTVWERLQLAPPRHRVLIGGTNGKGSTTTLLCTLLSPRYRVGMLTSPPLSALSETLWANGRNPEDAELLCHLGVVYGTAQRAPLVDLTYFELWVLTAFRWLQSRNLDVWLIEVGMGGATDATNVLDNTMAIITNVHLDHVHWLGNSVERIAAIKAGIVKDNVPLVFGGNPPAPAAITDKVRAAQSVCYAYKRDFNIDEADGQEYTFSFPSRNVNWMSLRIPLRGAHQIRNAASALAAAALLLPEHPCPGIIGAARPLPGRLTFFPGTGILMDAAHNPHGAAAAADYLRGRGRKMQAIWSALADKDLEGIVRPFFDLIELWFIAPLQHPRGAPIGRLEAALMGQNFLSVGSISEAVLAAVKDDGKLERPLFIFGSFCTLSEAMAELSGLARRKSQ